MIRFTLDGREVAANMGETIFAVATREGVELPHKCHKDGLTPAGNCRACVVEIAGERTLAPSCCRTPREGMAVVDTDASWTWWRGGIGVTAGVRLGAGLAFGVVSGRTRLEPAIELVPVQAGILF